VARRRDPGAMFVDWCQTAPLEAVETVLAICQWTVKRRRDDEAPKRPRAVKAKPEPRAMHEP